MQMVVLFQRAFIDGLKDQDKFLGGLILKVTIWKTQTACS